MKYPLPIEVVRGRRPTVTQEFGNHTNDAWYKANGVNLDNTGHNGTDIVITGGKNRSVDTYGTKLVCPVPNASLTKLWWAHEALNTKGNGIEIQWKDERGLIYVLCWHCSEVVEGKDTFKKGDPLGYMGNSGLVSPKPSYFAVHNGAHLHLGTWINGVLVNPREVFDFEQWFTTEVDTGIAKDLPPIQYFLNQVVLSLKSFIKSS
jgi:murein DD-endopeptidase MepM/ murein hydrolase activator NlpD